VLIPDGVEHKNLNTLATIYDQLIEGASSKSVFSPRGGVVGDIAILPQPLTSACALRASADDVAGVDSSVGGKTAVDHRAGN
jgi:3-dehydroquinate synthase